MWTNKKQKTDTINDLTNLSKQIRKVILDIIYESKSSHIGSAFSIVEILTTLYFYRLDLAKESFYKPKYMRDVFILSKGHACAALYATLFLKGLIEKETLHSFAKNGGLLYGHATYNTCLGIETTTGSLGHGISIGIGIAIAQKIHSSQKKTYVLVSDGELNEGSSWEGILYAGAKKLDNLVLIVDYNKIQSFGHVKEILDLEPLKEKFKAFNWSVRELDGHNLEQLIDALDCIPFEKDKPSCIIAHTIKGKGVSFMENKLEWHYKSPNEKDYYQALEELG